MKNLFSFDKRLGLLFKDMEVRNATFARYVYHPSQPSLGNRLCHKSSNSPKFVKKIDTLKFICNYLCYLPALQNLNVMQAEDQNVQHKEYTFQYYDVKK